MEKTVLFVGNLVPVKGIDRLFRAMAELPQARLRIVGDGPLRRKLARLAVKLGIHDRVDFLGRKPPKEVADLMRAADVLCLPSRSEGMPNVVLEALACGAPVVATAVGEIPFLIRDGVNGAVVAGEDDDTVAAGLAAALRTVLERDWDPQEISAGVRDYTWENAARTIVAAMLARRS